MIDTQLDKQIAHNLANKSQLLIKERIKKEIYIAYCDLRFANHELKSKINIYIFCIFAIIKLKFK